MARRTKYFTPEQKLAARKARQLRYYYRNKLGLNNLLVNKKPKKLSGGGEQLVSTINNVPPVIEYTLTASYAGGVPEDL